MKDFTLTNGNKIPALAYGTWLIKNENAKNCVLMALEAGYRHIDTAQAYGNEVGVGEGLKASGLKREDIYVTTKVQAEHKTYKKAKKSIDESLKKLGLDYVDLILIHCPQPWILFRKFQRRYDKANVAVYKVLEEYYKAGKIRAIGVSNFLPADLDNILNNCEVVPAVNQILAHVKNMDFNTINYCREKGIIIEAYSPLGHGNSNVLKDETIKEIANKYNVSVPQLCLRFTVELNMVTLPKSTNIAHMKSNGDLDFNISEEDMERLVKLDKIKDYGKDDWYPVFSKGKQIFTFHPFYRNILIEVNLYENQDILMVYKFNL